MGSEYFDYIRDLLMDRSGLAISLDKTYLIDTRLLPVARKHGYDTIADMVKALKMSHNEALAVEIAEAMNTHESLFFRDVEPFELFKKIILPQVLQRRKDTRRMRIWCAACSTGQEPYSLAMLLQEEAHRLSGWNMEIVATDISHSVLARAKEGLFSQFEVQRGLPVQMLVKHFTQEGDNWRISDQIRKAVTFKAFNLLTDPRGLGRFDVVFCRNVLIYFDLETKRKVLGAVGGVIAPDGVMFLGSSESTIGLTEQLWPVVAGLGVYKHTGAPPSLAELL